MTRVAIERLLADPATPAGMKEWLRSAGGSLLDPGAEEAYFLRTRVGMFARGADGIPFFAAMPDLAAAADRQERKIEFYGVSEGKLHYVDVELFMPDAKDRTYVDDLSHKPRLSDFPRDIRDERYARAGMLPFAVEHTFQLMVKSIRDGRLTDNPGQYPRDDHAARWAGYLAHYVEDNTQPHHATSDFKSRTYFPPTAKAPDPHGDIEYRLADDDYEDSMELRREFWPLFSRELDETKDAVTTPDLWLATLEVSLTSYDALPMIGRAAAAAYPDVSADSTGPFRAAAFFHFKGRYLGREMTVMQMKAHQMAWAVLRVETIWRQAWKQATGGPSSGAQN